VNIKDYISSGILEQYLLGHLSSDEEKEVETIIAQYPEVRQEYFMLSDTFEEMASQSAIEPPAELKASLMKEVGYEVEHAKSIERNLPPNPNIAKAVIAASLIGLAIMASVVYFCYSAKAELKEEITVLETQAEQLNADKVQLNGQIQQLSEVLQIMRSPSYNHINLKGLPIAPEAFAQVFWDAETEEAFLNPTNLPAPPSGKQYQLWAIVDNAPISMGVFDIPADLALLKMTPVAGATTFAITLEDRGGVESPTMEMMYVAGNVSAG